ncbi:MAG: hypothetical protein JNL70_06485 [Saprospiraceae bacterium]|nr:hypothetical protein [Saprospiraceae bacterium]
MPPLCGLGGQDDFFTAGFTRRYKYVGSNDPFIHVFKTTIIPNQPRLFCENRVGIGGECVGIPRE